MTEFTISVPEEEDIVYLIDNMRGSDINDLYALNEVSINDVVRESVLVSDEDYIFAVHADNCLIAIGGCRGSLDISGNEIGIPWLLGTKLLTKYSKKLTKTSIRGIKIMLERWDVLTNVISVENKSTIKWLCALGFKLKEQYEINPGYPIVRFEIRKDDNV